MNSVAHSITHQKCPTQTSLTWFVWIQGSCPITGGSRGEPKTAVALVKYEIDGNVFLKRYTNCYDKQAHAEDYFRYDITESPLKSYPVTKSARFAGVIGRPKCAV